MPEKFAESRKSIERLHPGHGKELEKPMYVSWGKIPYNEGSWIRSYGPGRKVVALADPADGESTIRSRRGADQSRL